MTTNTPRSHSAQPPGATGAPGAVPLLHQVLTAQKAAHRPDWLKSRARVYHTKWGTGQVVMVMGTYLKIQFDEENEPTAFSDWQAEVNSGALNPVTDQQQRSRLDEELGMIPPEHQGLLEPWRSWIRAIHWEPPTEGVYCPIPDDLPDSIKASLARLGIESLYSHQAEALTAIRDGKDVALLTAVATGKTYAFALPLMEAALTQKRTTLIILPTNSLANDQYKALRGIAPQRQLGPISVPILKVVMWTGDTRGSRDGAFEPAPDILITNIDSLHFLIPQINSFKLSGGLRDFLRRLQFVVIDEGQNSKGILGASTANVLRRLRNAISRIGADPWKFQHVLCSATVRNPVELVNTLTQRDRGRELVLIQESGAPFPGRTSVCFKSQGGGKRKLCKIATSLMTAARSTILFFNSRLTAKSLLQTVKQELQRQRRGDLSKFLALFHSSVSRTSKQQILERLNGEGLPIHLLFATSAMEVGVNFQSLEASVVYGFPGIGSLRQRWGRAGRGEEPGLCVLIPHLNTLDVYYSHHPDQLFGSPAEAVLLNPDYPVLLAEHLLAAASECGVAVSQLTDLFGPNAEMVAGKLLETRSLFEQEGVLLTDQQPHKTIAIRGTPLRRVQLIDLESGQVIEELNYSTALREVHEGAVYSHQTEDGEIVRYRCLQLLISETDLRAELQPMELDTNLATEPMCEFSYEPLVALSGGHKTLSTAQGEIRLELHWCRITTETHSYSEYLSLIELHCVNPACANHSATLAAGQSFCSLCMGPLEVKNLKRQQLATHPLAEPLCDSYEAPLLRLTLSPDLRDFINGRVGQIRERVEEEARKEGTDIPAHFLPLFDMEPDEVALHTLCHQLKIGVALGLQHDLEDIEERIQGGPTRPEPEALLYDTTQNGTGAAEGLFQHFGRVAEAGLKLAKECQCSSGCPQCLTLSSCVQDNRALYRNLGVNLLEWITGRGTDDNETEGTAEPR